MGYDNQLNLTSVRTFVLSVHSDQEARLWRVPFDPVVAGWRDVVLGVLYSPQRPSPLNDAEEATELPIKKFGVATAYCDGRLKVYTRKSGEG